MLGRVFLCWLFAMLTLGWQKPPDAEVGPKEKPFRFADLQGDGPVVWGPEEWKDWDARKTK